MDAVLLSLAASVSTWAGGLCALRFRARLHLVLGFTAGVMLGVVAFDLLPESFELSRRLGSDVRAPVLALAVGFLLFHGLEKLVLGRRVHEAACARHHHPGVGVLSAAALVGHSLMDGIGMGLAFQVSQPVGFTVAFAMITHDFCDGLNTVGLMLKHRNTTARALGMLALDAIAPVLGAVSTFAFSVPPEALVFCLAFFAGFLLYVGASAAASSIGLTALGASFIYAVVCVAG